MPNRLIAGYHKMMNSGLRWLWVSILILFLDRSSKYFLNDFLIPFQPYPILPFFNLTLAYNKGAAFSFLHNAAGWQNLLLGSLAVFMSIFILVWLARVSSQKWSLSIALSLILGGALGNAWDRKIYGFVVDFLDFHLGSWHFAIFNIADSAICMGTALLIFSWLREEKAK